MTEGVLRRTILKTAAALAAGSYVRASGLAVFAVFETNSQAPRRAWSVGPAVGRATDPDFYGQ